jgi:hypothetical protein
MCLAIGFDKMMADIVLNMVQQETVDVVNTGTSPEWLEKTIKDRCNVAMSKVRAQLPYNCPGGVPMEGAEAKVKTDSVSGSIDVSLDLALNKPLRLFNVSLEVEEDD